MDSFGLLQLAVFLAAAAIAAPLAKKLKIGSVLGYLFAGLLIGPHGVGIIYQLYDLEQIRHIAEFGVVLLLFVIGLELRPRRVWAMRQAIFGTGGAQMALSGLALMGLALAAGLTPRVALFIGLSLALSSTAFALQVLEEKGELNTQHGRKAFSVLLFQDLAAIPLIALVPLFAVGPGASKAGMDAEAAAIALATIAGIVIVGHYLLNHVYRLIAMTKVREAMTASALLTVVGVSIAMNYAGLSAAMGAFIAGVILADSEYRHQIEADLAPFVGLLLGLFFISIGMSLDVYALRDQPLQVVLVALGLVAVKFAVMYGIGRWRGLEDAPARRLAIVLSQGGEFAFVLLATGTSAFVLEPDQAGLFSVAVTLSMMTTPLLLLADDQLQKRRAGAGQVRVYDKPRGQQGHVIVAGLGRFGQIIARILSARQVPFIALDTSTEQIDSLKKAGYTGYYGDASRLSILRAARIDKAAGLVIAVNDIEGSLKIARLVGRHFPDLPLFARARDRQHVYQLMDAGVTVIHRETFLSAVEMTRDVLTEAFEEDRGQVDSLLARFVAYDRQRLYDAYRQCTDADRRTMRGRATAKELEALFNEASIEEDAPQEGEAGGVRLRATPEEGDQERDNAAT